MSKKIIGRECKFVLHLEEIAEVRPDTHVVKEIIHYEDGTTEPNLRTVYGFKRPFWITKPHYQNHTDKKESEDISKLNEFTSTQSRLATSIAARLGQRYVGKKTLREVSSSPYVYGTDVSSCAYIKNTYRTKYPDAISNNKVAVLDIEVNTETNTMIVLALAMEDKLFCAIHNDLIKNYKDVNRQLEYLFDKYIPKTFITENIKKEFLIVKDEGEMIIESFKRAHEWKPDICAIWNINYDIPYILSKCEKFNIDPKDVFSDPNLPKELRYFRYKEAADVKKKASGISTPVNVEDQWHVVYTPAHFWWIDAMSAYRQIRIGSKTVSGGFSLDNVLKKTLGDSLMKLKFEDGAEVHKGIDWHKYMVKNKPLEYIIYNNWDVLSILHLDDTTKDLKSTISVLSGISGFDIFNSGPKRIVDALHFFYIERGKVLATRDASNYGSDDDDEDSLLGLKGWIVLLPSSRIKENGAKVIKENPNLTTNMRFYTYDVDQVSGYPSNTQACNVSKDTTRKEIIAIGSHGKEFFIINNINLMFGKVSHVEYCTNMFKFPELLDLKKNIKEKIEREETAA